MNRASRQSPGIINHPNQWLFPILLDEIELSLPLDSKGLIRLAEKAEIRLDLSEAYI